MEFVTPILTLYEPRFGISNFTLAVAYFLRASQIKFSLGIQRHIGRRSRSRVWIVTPGSTVNPELRALFTFSSGDTIISNRMWVHLKNDFNLIVLRVKESTFRGSFR